MLLIPEIETVVILPPRTGSGSLYRAVLAAYPKAMMPYRHMEADGIPFGYDRWRRIGVLRHPLYRLWSLYNYLSTMGIAHATDRPQHSDYHELMRESVRCQSFETWLLREQEIFTCHHDRFGNGKVYPEYAVKHAYPETKKSQFVYLRPDLGVEIVPYMPDGSAIAHYLGIEIPHLANVVNPGQPPELSPKGVKHINTYHSWDFWECDKHEIPLA